MSKATEQPNSITSSERGAGPTVVLLHGLFGSGSNLAQLAANLADNHRVVSLDLPGHGHSHPIADYALSSIAQVVLNKLQNLNIQRCALVGHSLGGKIAMQLAADAESNQALTITRLVIVDIAPRHYPPHHNAVFEGLNRVPLSGLTSRSQADEILSETIPEPATRAFLLKSLKRDKNNQWRWLFDLLQLESQYRKIAQAPEFSQAVQCPTLFIKGANSDYILPMDEQPIREAFANPQFKIIGNAGHWPHAEKPEVFNGLVSRFLNA